MAQLKDTIVAGDLSTTGNMYGATLSTSGEINAQGNISSSKTSSNEAKVVVSNDNGVVGLSAANNRGVWDYTGEKWMVYSGSGIGSPTKTTSYTGTDYGLRNIAIGTTEPTGGNDGDVYIQYNGGDVMSSIVDIIYPIGSIYMNVGHTNPAILFGGTWERVGQGQFLLGWSSDYTIGDTGGATHVSLSTANLPSHAHDTSQVCGNESSGYGLTQTGGFKNRVLVTGSGYMSSSVGSGTVHGNMPPYLVVAMWKRVA